MRQFSMAFILSLILIGGIRCIMVVNTVQLYQQELDLAVEKSVKNSLWRSIDNKYYSINTDEELYTDFLSELFLRLKTNSGCNINVYQLDKEKGIMDIEVSQKINIYNNYTKIIKCRKYARVDVYN